MGAGAKNPAERVILSVEPAARGTPECNQAQSRFGVPELHSRQGHPVQGFLCLKGRYIPSLALAQYFLSPHLHFAEGACRKLSRSQ